MTSLVILVFVVLAIVTLGGALALGSVLSSRWGGRRQTAVLREIEQALEDRETR